ncbi:MAG TPA: hypothetical protein VEA81_02675 [Burkholderiaceae bacterium]|nr:hypothetical protein [Burkholderiaceae bacterium]
MFIGHFGAALGAKRLAPELSLGTLMLAAQLVDLLWPTFLLLGWERVEIRPGASGAVPLAFEHYPWSHSLLAVLGWGALVGVGLRAAGASTRACAVAAVLVLSHWILDALVHVPDLPLAPGGAARIGLGLWNQPLVVLVLELALFAGGLASYRRSTAARDRIGTRALVGLAALLVAIHVGNVFGPPPPDVAAIAWVGQAQWLLVMLAFWVDRHRTPAR